ncbi:MAG TPA: radical SAM protein [Thermoanaerobacterales bacterium]|nr:radical SAM protein [Thermoanaerobacterales bacterium]
MSYIMKCRICPHECKVNRKQGEKGFCKAGENVVIANASIHRWEEPCISGNNGSGTVFFTGCNLRCVFCQNYTISQEGYGKPITVEKLAKTFIKLQGKGVHNINLVTPTIYAPQIIEALNMAKEEGLNIPVIWNSNAYESVEMVKNLSELVDVFLPDLKYFDDNIAKRYSKVKNYFSIASKAILQMYSQVGNPIFNKKGIIQRGLIIRHLVLPGQKEDSKKILSWISENLPKDIYISIMSQYIPYYRASEYPEINRKLYQREYEDVVEHFFKIGLENGFIQDESAASDEFIPKFKE